MGKKLLRDLKPNTPLNRSITKNHITAIIVARSKSRRLPNKAIKKICGVSTIEHLIRRVKKSKKIDMEKKKDTKKKQIFNVEKRFLIYKSHF